MQMQMALFTVPGAIHTIARLRLTTRNQTADFSSISRETRALSVSSLSKMVLKYRDKEISSLDDIQNLTAKNLREILRSYSESTGGVKADLVLKASVRFANARSPTVECEQ